MSGPRDIEVTCTLDIEQTGESFHAHAIPLGIDIRPGDRVLVHGAPSRVAFGTRLSVPCRATVTRAGWLRRAWTQATALFELTELYEVGFAPKETP
jgi:hypothetical protein